MNFRKVKTISDNVLIPGSQVLALASGESYIRSFSEIIERLTKKQGRKGILISTLWSANALTRRIALSKLPRDSLKIIDTISLSLGTRIAPDERFVFLSTPVSLESILMEIERIMRMEGGDRNFIILDSLTYLERYYTRGQLNEFFHFLLNRTLEEEFMVLIFDHGRENEEILEELSAMIDYKLSLTGGGDRK